MKYPKVSIIVLNWNGLEDTTKCLDSLRQITYPDYEVIVVDNASAGDDVAVLKKNYGEYIHLIENDENYGYSEGNNIGMRYALEKGADYILILNNDTVVDPRFLDELVAVAGENANIGVVGSKLYDMTHPDVLQGAGGKLNWYLEHRQRGQGKKDRGQFDEVADVDFLGGSCMLVRKEAIEKSGLLPTEYFLQWEDIDYCIGVRRQGFRCVYAPKAKIWHKLSASFDRAGISDTMVARGIKNRFLFRRKYLSTPRFLLFTLSFIFIVTPAYMIYYLVYYRDPRRILNFFRGMGQGFKATFR